MSEIIVVLGPPGSGKTTHCKRMAEQRLGDKEICHISIGDRLRAIMQGDVDSSLVEQIGAPNAIPFSNELVNNVVFEFVSGCEENSIVIVDGYPRRADAIELFLKSIEQGNHSLLGCINLENDREVSLSRIGVRGVRRGEREFAILTTKERLDDYLTVTTESVSALRNLTRVVDVNASGEEEVVWGYFRESFLYLTLNGISW